MNTFIGTTHTSTFSVPTRYRHRTLASYSEKPSSWQANFSQTQAITHMRYRNSKGRKVRILNKEKYKPFTVCTKQSKGHHPMSY